MKRYGQVTKYKKVFKEAKDYTVIKVYNVLGNRGNMSTIVASFYNKKDLKTCLDIFKNTPSALFDNYKSEENQTVISNEKSEDLKKSKIKFEIIK